MPDKYNISCIQGTSFKLDVTLKHANGTIRDLTGYTANLAIKNAYSYSTTMELLSTANGEITINATAGQLTLQLPYDRTANLYVDPNNGTPPVTQYVYDINIKDTVANTVEQIMYGQFNVLGEVTKLT